MSKPLARLTESVFADMLVALFGVPTATATTVFQEFMRRRSNEAREILIEQIRTGDIDTLEAASEDDAIAIIYRYCLAARDGAEHRNLRLLARAIVGLARRDRLYSDDFNRYANILSPLSRDEILVAGRFYALRNFQVAETTGSREGSDAWSALKKEMVPTQFASQDHLEAICALLAGAGLVIPINVFGGQAYRPTPILMEIGELAVLEDMKLQD